MVHIYYGDGKGKTSAALGVALRAAGRRRKVLLCRFLKDDYSGEVEAISTIDNIHTLTCGCIGGFFTEAVAEDRQHIINEQRKTYTKLLEIVKEDKYDLIVLDEALWLVEFGIISEQELLALIKTCKYAELILTGGTVTQGIIDAADYVTNMKKISHPYDKGQLPRPGIEF